MENIDKIIELIDSPVIVWKLVNKTYYCSYYNERYYKEYESIFEGDIIDKQIKDIYQFYNKDYYKYYEKCIKKKIEQNYEIFENGKKTKHKLINIDGIHILEKLIIIEIDNNDILKDPFNMIILIYKQTCI